MACDGRRPDLPGHRHAHVLHSHAGRGEPARDPPAPPARPSPKRRAWASCVRIRWIRSPARTAATISAQGTPVIHFEQWEEDEIEVKLILKGGGCENKNIQYSLPCPIEGLGRADRNLEGVRKCILHAVWQAQGQGCSPGALGVCIGSDRAHGYELAKVQLLPAARRRQSGPGAGGAGSAHHGRGQPDRRRRRWASAARYR